MESKKLLLKNQIKLVIWDLDETFWEGTLSEEGIKIIPENSEIVVELVNRGIMNSICSKNTFEEAKTVLRENHLWEYFIFPKIAWSPKGLMVKEIIEKAQLRAENVLFIDDNHSNLEEVKYYNPEINVIYPEQISELLGNDSLKGKDDRQHSRLKQYKILEAKSRDIATYSSNEEFLKHSKIRVEMIENCQDHIERIHELILRTNQLNFTKNRMERNDLLQIINDPAVKKACIKVYDNYGDYGIVGFYALKSNKFIHFVFSCRTLNLGVEQWVYSQLGFPELMVEGDVTTQLRKDFTPHWINRDNSNVDNVKETNQMLNIKCLMRGGCDLDQVFHYLTFKNISVFTEFNYVSKSGFNIHRDHTEILKQSQLLNEEIKADLIKNIPFYDENVFNTSLFTSEFDVLIYSVLMDYTNGIYVNKANENIKVIYGDYALPLVDKENWELIIQNHGGKISRDFLEWFSTHFEFAGVMSESDFLNGLNWLRNSVPEEVPILFLNGSELPFEHQWEKNRYLHHQKMNKILSEFDSSHENTYIVDINQFVTSADDITNNIRHYQREVYKKISYEIIDYLENRYGFTKKLDTKQYLKNSILNSKHVLKSKIKNLVKN